MTKPLLFDIDPALMLREIFVPSPDGSTFDIVTQQDVEPVLAENQAQRRDQPKHQFNSKKSDLTKVASIPNVVMIRLREQGILDDPDRFKQWLNDPENEIFRTSRGNV